MQNLGHEHDTTTAWPEADETLAADNEIEVGVQVNGKLRHNYAISDCEMLMPKHVHWSQKLVSAILMARHQKVIVVKNRIVNVVISKRVKIFAGLPFD